MVTLTQVGTGVYLGQTHLGTPFQVTAWVRKFSLGSTGDDISSLIIIIQSLFVQLEEDLHPWVKVDQAEGLCHRNHLTFW